MKTRLALVGLMALGPTLLLASPARAGIDACGDIHVEANAQCELDVSGGCTARCTPVSFESKCSVELEGGCRGMCTADAEASCSGSCDVSSCTARCKAKPAEFNCSADCYAEGSAMCDAQCDAGDGHAECVASCRASFSARCDASCQGQAGSVDCEAQCQASCQGQCDAKANVDCDIACQTPELYAQCEAKAKGGCEAECSAPDGALFCDGQYVDYNDNAQKCLDALKAIVHAEVSGSASGDCSVGECHAEAEGSAKASCAVAPATSGNAPAAWLLAGLGLSVFGARRRRRR